MKGKKHLACGLLLGALAAAACAQGTSNVTLYGRVDIGLRLEDPEFGSSTTAVVSGVHSGSRWGLIGSEDLGNGLKAIFNLESGFNTDTGTMAQGGRLFGRQAWAGIEGGFGQVRLGRIDLVGNDITPAVDPFLTAFGDAGMQSTFSPPDIGRTDNAIIYTSPKLAGATVYAGYATRLDGVEVPGRSNNPWVTTSGVRYASGPLLAILTYEAIHNPAAGAPSAKMVQVGATYDLAVVKLHAIFGTEKDMFTGATVTNSADSRSHLLGLSAPVGSSGKLLTSYQKRDDRTADNADLRVFAAGYLHALSRRTNLYAYVSDADGKGSIATNAGFNRRQYVVGMRHLF